MFNTIPPITRNLIIINIVVYVVTNFILYALHNVEFYFSLAAYYPFSPFFKSWQIITSMFMHAPFDDGSGLMHIIFNMFTLFSFGPILENVLGGKKYLILYFLSGLGAFFLYNLWNFIEIQQFTSSLENYGFDLNSYFEGQKVSISGNSQAILEQQTLLEKLKTVLRTPMLGASGAIFGVVAAFATLYPEARIGIMFIPIPVKVKYVLPIVILGSIGLGVTGNVGGIAHLAHVGGAIVGFILAKIWKKRLYQFN